MTQDPILEIALSYIRDNKWPCVEFNELFKLYLNCANTNQDNLSKLLNLKNELKLNNSENIDTNNVDVNHAELVDLLNVFDVNDLIWFLNNISEYDIFEKWFVQRSLINTSHLFDKEVSEIYSDISYKYLNQIERNLYQPTVINKLTSLKHTKEYNLLFAIVNEPWDIKIILKEIRNIFYNYFSTKINRPLSIDEHIMAFHYIAGYIYRQNVKQTISIIKSRKDKGYDV